MAKEQTKTKVIRGGIHMLAWHEQGNMSFLITKKCFVLFCFFFAVSWNQCEGKATGLEQVVDSTLFSYKILLLSMAQAVIKTGCWNWEEDQKELVTLFMWELWEMNDR